MKKREIALIALLVLWFAIVIYQNYRILEYSKVLDERQWLIYKDTGRIIWDMESNKEQLKKLDNMIQANYIEIKRSN